MGKSRTPRRRFLQIAATAAASGAAFSCGSRRSTWRFFSDAEAATAAAVVNRIVPPDGDAGAADAGVVAFLDLQLAGPYARFAPAYREGLAAIEKAGAAAHGKPFAQLAPDQQDALLAKSEKEGAFFAMIVSHTMQGYYGDPRHGGNRDMAAWRMLGLAPTVVRGRDQYDFAKVGRG